MINISLYAEQDLFDRVDIPDTLYKKLVESEFFKLGDTKKNTILIEKEVTEISAIFLDFEIRNKLSKFLRDTIIKEVAKVTASLNYESPQEKEMETLYEIKIISDLRKLVEDERYHYME
jgi:hypothetical protein